MPAARYLCSELVFLEIGQTRTVVILEEIWPEGAVIECENTDAQSPPQTGVRLRLRAGRHSFWGEAVRVEAHEFGCRVEVKFSPMTPWKREEYSPQHLLDPTALGAAGADPE